MRTKHHLLSLALSTAIPPEPAPRPRALASSKAAKPDDVSALPDELLESLLLLPPLLSPSVSLPPASLQLLLSKPPFTGLDAQIPQLSDLVASHLRTSALHLARLANPSTNPSYLHRHIATLPSHITALQSTSANLESQLTALRQETLISLLTLLQSYATALSQHIRILEAKHGTVSRSLELQAAETALKAQKGEVEAEMALWRARREVYDSEARDALGRYADHLRDAMARLEESVNGVRRELADYGIGGGQDDGRDDRADGEDSEGRGRRPSKEKTMMQIATVYRDLGRQIDEAKVDLARLEKS
jgi:chromosome segregation ATPase